MAEPHHQHKNLRRIIRFLIATFLALTTGTHVKVGAVQAGAPRRANSAPSLEQSVDGSHGTWPPGTSPSGGIGLHSDGRVLPQIAGGDRRGEKTAESRAVDPLNCTANKQPTPRPGWLGSPKKMGIHTHAYSRLQESLGEDGCRKNFFDFQR